MDAFVVFKSKQKGIKRMTTKCIHGHGKHFIPICEWLGTIKNMSAPISCAYNLDESLTLFITLWSFFYQTFSIECFTFLWENKIPKFLSIKDIIKIQNLNFNLKETGFSPLNFNHKRNRIFPLKFQSSKKPRKN